MASQAVEDKALTGMRVLVPRGGSWGDLVAKALRDRGANPVIAPLVDFAQTSEEERLVEALRDLEAGSYDWITATTATVVDVLAHHQAHIPPETKVAVTGEATAAAFAAAGYRVSRTPPPESNTPAGLLQVWPEIDAGEVLKMLTLRSDVAKPVLTEGLISRGHNVTQVVAFRTVGVPVSVHIREDVMSGRINAILMSTPRIAREVAKQFPDLPATTVLSCVGPGTAEEAQALGLCREIAGEMREQQQAIVATIDSIIDQGDLQD